MQNETNEKSEITFNGVVEEVLRWTKILSNTAENILESSKKKE